MDPSSQCISQGDIELYHILHRDLDSIPVSMKLFRKHNIFNDILVDY